MDRETDSDTDRETDREMDNETDRLKTYPPDGSTCSLTYVPLSPGSPLGLLSI